MTITPPFAHVGGLLATDLVQVADLRVDPSVLDHGWWVVVGTFEGALTGYRFGRVVPADLPAPTGRWSGPPAGHWRSSLDRDAYLAGVRRIREFIEAGDVYQVNLCRLLRAPLAPDVDPLGLAHRLAVGNPAPWSGLLHLGESWIVTASPELFLSRDGDRLASSPIKGTTRPGEPFADKDYPENIMITDLVRNDLGRIARPGSVVVTELLARQEHPGLAHLVSTVTARLAGGIGWGEIVDATFPPGSVTGAPKIRALEVIGELEPVPRQVYCGAFGFVDGDRRRARLAVAIRTFFASRDCGPDSAGAPTFLHFGTGAGITYSSDPQAEWEETELKAARLIALTRAAGSTNSDPGRPDPAPGPATEHSPTPR
ncbi:MAG TPA: anthranilate synthase component I family protein [Nakamurella sp.]|jgi:para-aminobenzoate synthetase component 1